MKSGDDPRTDQHPNDGTPGKFPEPGQSNPQKAPGGAGTGTRNDPAREPAAQPDGGKTSPSGPSKG